MSFASLGSSFLDRNPKATLRRVSNGVARLPTPTPTQLCQQCYQERPKSQFALDHRFREPIRKSVCNGCLADNRRKASRDYHRKHQPRFSAYMKEWRKTRGFGDIYEWRQRNRAKYNAYQRQYRKENPVTKEKEKTYRANWLAKNPDYNKQYYEKNKKAMIKANTERRRLKRQQARLAS